MLLNHPERDKNCIATHKKRCDLSNGITMHPNFTRTSTVVKYNLHKHTSSMFIYMTIRKV